MSRRASRGQGDRRRRYQSLMKTWRRLRQLEPNQQTQLRRAQRRLLEELRALELEADGNE